MPSEKQTFTTTVDPNSPPQILVEAPGTAPGSVSPIPRTVYRHSEVLTTHTS